MLIPIPHSRARFPALPGNTKLGTRVSSPEGELILVVADGDIVGATAELGADFVVREGAGRSIEEGFSDGQYGWIRL